MLVLCITHRFLHAFQHLEQIGKLRMARFTNTGDIVPLIPFHGLSHSYKHAAMHIRLLGVDRYAQYWLRQALDVSYPKNQGLLSQMWRGWLNSFVRNWNTLKGERISWVISRTFHLNSHIDLSLLYYYHYISHLHHYY